MNHPNAFFVPRPEGGKAITFDAFIQHFPFNSDAFHFRFQAISRSCEPLRYTVAMPTAILRAVHCRPVLKALAER